MPPAYDLSDGLVYHKNNLERRRGASAAATPIGKLQDCSYRISAAAFWFRRGLLGGVVCRVLRVVSLVLMAVVLLFCVSALALGVRGMAACVFLEHLSV